MSDRTRRGLTLAMLAALAAPAAAATSTTVDLDGDGVVETITGDEVLSIAGRTWKASVRLPGKAKLETITAARLGNGQGSDKLMAVELEVGAKRKRELWVGKLGAGSAGSEVIVSELARLPLGPQGSDEEYAAAAELTAKGLVRWQTRGDLVRCDGAPLRLFAERWEPATRKWQPAPASEVPTTGDGVAAVSAVSPVSGQPGQPGQAAPPAHSAQSALFAVRAPTSQRGAGRADELGPPAELTDENVKTAWRPSAAGSDGRGEVLSFRSRLGKASKATRLRVVPGDASSPAALRASSRPAKLWVIGPKQKFAVTLPDPAGAGAAYVIALPQPIEECVSVVIEAAYPGSGAGDRSLAISELSVETDLEQKADSAQAIAELVRKGDGRAERMLAQMPQAQVARALLGELTKTSDVAEKRRLVRVMAQLSEKELSEPLVAALREGWIGEADVSDAIYALSRIGDDAALVELVVAPGASPAIKEAVARRLAGRGSDQLIELAGLGSTEIRREVIDGLAKLPQDKLLAAADRHGDSPAAMGDLWRAAVRRLFPPWLRDELPDGQRDGLRGQALVDRAELTAALAAKWPAAKEYERRYRLATALAELAARSGERTLLATLMSKLAEVPEPESAALRQAVAATAARLAGPAITTALEQLLKDRDAGVRLATVRGLALGDDATNAPGAAGAPGAPASAPVILDGPPPDRSGAPPPSSSLPYEAERLAVFHTSMDRGLGEVLAGDRWPELRRAAAGALAHRCQRPEPAAALGRSVDGDRDVDVRQDALVALVTCAAPGISERLVRTWDSGKAPLPLRERAVSLAVMLGDRRLSPQLVRSLSRWRSEAFSDGDSLRLAVQAAGALGRLGGPDAAGALLAALDDGAYPELVAAAASGLGALGEACPAAAKAKLAPLTRSEERQISLAAKRALARCGSAAPSRAPVPEP